MIQRWQQRRLIKSSVYFWWKRGVWFFMVTVEESLSIFLKLSQKNFHGILLFSINFWINCQIQFPVIWNTFLYQFPKEIFWSLIKIVLQNRILVYDKLPKIGFNITFQSHCSLIGTFSKILFQIIPQKHLPTHFPISFSIANLTSSSSFYKIFQIILQQFFESWCFLYKKVIATSWSS